MRFLKPIILAAILAGLIFSVLGCATKPQPVRYVAPSSAPVRATVEKAAVAVKDVRANISKAAENVQAAATEVRAIVAELPADLQPKVNLRVEGLEMRLTVALRDLADAEAKAASAEESLAASGNELGKLQGKIDQQTTDLETTSGNLRKADAALEETKTKLSAAVGLKWRWQVYFFGLIALVAAFFIARQYFPFLKLI